MQFKTKVHTRSRNPRQEAQISSYPEGKLKLIAAESSQKCVEIYSSYLHITITMMFQHKHDKGIDRCNDFDSGKCSFGKVGSEMRESHDLDAHFKQARYLIGKRRRISTQVIGKLLHGGRKKKEEEGERSESVCDDYW
ncbi:hypothetical protein K1719_038322 [Acacia pycnantha]|nr:hypothetical protein K1719_038322 [Acacia pycnantha]